MVIGLGGNTTGTLEAFSRARTWLASILDRAAFSSLYRSAPQLDLDQEVFWNAAASGAWAGTAEGLLERLLVFEAGVGRVRDPQRPKGPRLLDLDLLIFGGETRSTARLTLPHPGLASRRFALEPLLELVPDAVDPRTGRPWRLALGGVLDQAVDRTDQTW